MLLIAVVDFSCCCCRLFYFWCFKNVLLQQQKKRDTKNGFLSRKLRNSFWNHENWESHQCSTYIRSPETMTPKITTNEICPIFLEGYLRPVSCASDLKDWHSLKSEPQTILNFWQKWLVDARHRMEKPPWRHPRVSSANFSRAPISRRQFFRLDSEAKE